MIAAFVPDISVWGVGLQGLVLFALYCLGMAGALVVAWILKHTTGKGENRTLMLELPSYHMPRLDALAHGLWQRASIYLQKVGTIILALTVFLWVLTTFPAAPAGAADPAINYSFAGMLGRAMEPLFAPIGFNWQMCVSLVPAMGAREVAVSVLGTLYATASEAEDAPRADPAAQLDDPDGALLPRLLRLQPVVLCDARRHQARDGYLEGARRAVGGLYASRLRLLIRRLPRGALGLRIGLRQTERKGVQAGVRG